MTAASLRHRPNWYEVYVYGSGSCLFVPVSAARLD